MSSQPTAFQFGGEPFPLKCANRHLFFLGATGSGKSVSIRQFTDAFLPEIGKHSAVGGYRALLYDAKNELLAQIWEIEDILGCPVQLTNPFDRRAASWDIAKDCTSRAAAYEMASILCPVSEHAVQPFFEHAALNMLSGALIASHLRAPGEWDLRTVCMVMRSDHHLTELLSQSSVTRHLVRRYLQDGKLKQSVMATLDSKMEPYSVIAALWSKAKTKFSLRDFRDGESVLILGNNEESRKAIDAINRVLMQRLTELLLAQGDSDTRRTLICLDEVREAGKLECLSSLALRGRSRGVVLVAGAQDKDGLEEVYGEAVAHELLGQFGFIAILKLDSPTTAKWASTKFGATEVKERNNQMSRSTGDEEIRITRGVSEVLRERDVVLPNQIMNLPTTSGREGLHGFYKTPYGSFASHVDFVPLLRRRSREALTELPSNYNFQERTENDQYLDDWTAEELARFGLTPIPLDEEPQRRSRPPRQPRGLDRNQGRRQDRNESHDNKVDREDSEEEGESSS